MFAHADLDDSDDDSKDYHLIMPAQILVNNNRGISLPFTMPNERIQVDYYLDRGHTLYIAPFISPHRQGYENNIIPSLLEMVNSVYASQVKFLLEDIYQEINNKSYVKLRLSLHLLKSFSKIAILGVGAYFSAKYFFSGPDESIVMRKMMKDAVEFLEGTCSDTFSVSNITCRILSNDPPICLANPDNCPSSDCNDVTGLLQFCEYLSPSLGVNTHDLVKYSTNLYERLQHCNGTAWHDYLSACKEYQYYFNSIPLGLLAATFIILFTPLILTYQCVFNVCQYDTDFARREERDRLLNSKFRNLFDRDILQDNFTNRALLQLEDEREDVSVGEVVNRLERMNDFGYHYTTSRFFRAHNEPRIEVVEEEVEEEQRLIHPM